MTPRSGSNGRGSFRGSQAMGGAASVASSRRDGASVGGFTTGDLHTVLPVMRRTASAASVMAQEGLTETQRLLVSMPLKQQRATRLLCSELAELVSRYQTAYDRCAGDDMDDDAPLPDVLLGINAAVEDTTAALVRVVGPQVAVQFIRLIEDDDVRAAMGLGGESEEFQEDGTEARVWRRRLARFKSRRFEGGIGAAAEEAEAAKRGVVPPSGRDLFGSKGRDPRAGSDNVSYYRKQTRKYGRGRRGSTAYQGAWDSVFAEQKSQGHGGRGGGASGGGGGGMFSPMA